jgi:hypothetical protein
VGDATNSISGSSAFTFDGTTVDVNGNIRIESNKRLRFGGTGASDYQADIWYNATGSVLNIENLFISGDAGGVIKLSTDTQYISIDDPSGFISVQSNIFQPSLNATTALGTPSLRWTDVYSIAGDFSGQVSISASGSRSSSGVQISASTPSYGWRATGGAANTKQWDMPSTGATLLGRAISDDDATAAQWFGVTRVATAISDISFGNTTDNPTFQILGTGSFLVSGNTAIGRAASGGSVTVYSQNTSNTAGSSAGFVASVQGTTADDPFFTATIPGGSTATWGLDNSVSGDPFVLAFSNALGSSNIFSTTATVFSLLAILKLAASTTAGPTLNIPSGTAPTSPSDGDMWYDGTNVKFRVGGTTKTFTLT